MARAGNLDWLFHLIGAALVAAGIVLLLLALLRDRSRGRRRCPRCWYDMAGTPGLQCPECGRQAGSERRLFKTRRRWKLAAMAAALMIAGACVAAVPTYRSGWQRLVPTSVLSVIAPAEDPTSSMIAQRAAAGLLPQGNVLSGLPIIGGVFAAPPVLTVGETLTDEMWGRIAEGKAAGWQSSVFVRRYLSAHPHDFSESITLPERWPVGLALPVRIVGLVPGAMTQALIDGSVRLEGGKAGAQSAHGDELDAIASPTDEVTVVVELRRGRSVLYSRKLTMPCEIRPDDEQFLDRVGGEPIDSRIREALSPQMAWGPTRRGTFITRDRTTAAKWNLLKLGISFDIELREGGDVLARGRGAAEWNRPVWKDWEDIEPEWAPGGLERTIAAGTGYSGLSFRVRGNPGEARRQYLLWPWGKRPACWTGEFEMAVPGQPTPRDPR